MSDSLAFFFSLLIGSLPTIVIAVVGVVLCRSKLPHAHVKARRFATSGFILLGAQALVGAAMRTYATSVATASGDRLAMVNTISLIGLVTYLLLATSLILLLCAVLADRDPMGSSRGSI